ncbi:CRISPR-associated protein Cas5 [Clostridium perfringens]|uniref:CRISPR-associated protein Cas5 n=1 Tax=Clostridium perfringens TaxID=1502 RepID=UPI001ABB2776|nr:CRISPR-associated protein Cas5 [Clostridium perfringens]MBO3319253.1 CRISPR-associated protein Cas5 [Clostridium perfringens]
MKALRIILTQNSANYRREETTVNKMTYPLPPFSTVIGAIHNACNYKEYKPMDISIQGTYESMGLEPYTDYCFLNTVMDDRGILVKLRNGKYLSNSFDKVAKALKSQGNSFREGKTIQVYNEKLLEEYRNLKDLKDKIDEFSRGKLKEVLNLIKLRKKTLSSKKKELKDNKEKLELIKKREFQIKNLEKRLKSEFDDYKEKNYNEPYSKFASLTTSLKYYETLYNVKLIIHVRCEDENTLLDIKENIYNLKSIGRSEDFVDIKEVKIVDLVEEAKEMKRRIVNTNSAYVDYNLVKGKIIRSRNLSDSKECNGTKYLLNKNYEILDRKRVFKKKKVVYLSNYVVRKKVDNVYYDLGEEESYIVNFI